MSDWKTTELFQARSNAQHRAYLVGQAIAALGNRNENGWTHASLDRIAWLARLDRKTANLGINDLERLGELEYQRGTSRSNPSRYRIRVEALRDNIDRFRSSPNHGRNSHGDYGRSAQVTMGDPGFDRGNSVPQPWANHPPTMDETPTVPI